MAGRARTRRRWSHEEKRQIVAQTLVPGMSVSQVARRYDVNANLVFTWRRDPRLRPSVEQEREPTFLPVEEVSGPVPSGASGRRPVVTGRRCASDRAPDEHHHGAGHRLVGASHLHVGPVGVCRPQDAPAARRPSAARTAAMRPWAAGSSGPTYARSRPPTRPPTRSPNVSGPNAASGRRTRICSTRRRIRSPRSSTGRSIPTGVRRRRIPWRARRCRATCPMSSSSAGEARAGGGSCSSPVRLSPMSVLGRGPGPTSNCHRLGTLTHSAP